MEQKTVRKLEKGLEAAISEVIVVDLGLRHLPPLPSRQTMHLVNYLKGLAKRLEREQAAGIPFLLKDLPKDHPAIRFAKEVTPDFGR